MIQMLITATGAVIISCETLLSPRQSPLQDPVNGFVFHSRNGLPRTRKKTGDEMVLQIIGSVLRYLPSPSLLGALYKKRYCNFRDPTILVRKLTHSPSFAFAPSLDSWQASAHYPSLLLKLRRPHPSPPLSNPLFHLPLPPCSPQSKGASSSTADPSFYPLPTPYQENFTLTSCTACTFRPEGESIFQLKTTSFWSQQHVRATCI